MRDDGTKKCLCRANINVFSPNLSVAFSRVRSEELMKKKLVRSVAAVSPPVHRVDSWSQ